jgi:hypothetical protein
MKNMRKSFYMTEPQYERIRRASAPMPYTLASQLPANDESARYAWSELGQELHFDWTTARPSGPDERSFTAEAVASVWVNASDGRPVDGSSGDAPLLPVGNTGPMEPHPFVYGIEPDQGEPVVEIKPEAGKLGGN